MTGGNRASAAGLLPERASYGLGDLAAIGLYPVPDEYVLIGPPTARYAHYRLEAAGIAAEVRELRDIASGALPRRGPGRT